jgi:PAS domain S-box-containing protein
MQKNTLLSKSKQPPISRFDLNKNVNTVLAYWDKNEICRFINNAAFNWFGIHPEQVIDKMTTRDFFGALYEQNRPFITGALNGKTQVFDCMIPIASGNVLNARITHVPDFDGKQVKGMFVLVTNVGSIKIDDKPVVNDSVEKNFSYNYHTIEDVEQTLKTSLLTGFPGIANLAKKHYLSESKLKRDFKNKYGTTIFAYYRKLQMELANKYINAKKYNKNELALMFNFSNPSNFSSCYKKYLQSRQETTDIANTSYINYKKFVEQSAAAVAMFDIHMHFIATSKKWLDAYSLTGTELAGKSLNEVLPDIEKKLKKLQLDLLKGRFDNYPNVAILRKQDKPESIKLDIQPWYNNIDEIGGVLIFTEDITALKQTEEKDKQFFEILKKTNEIERIGTWYHNFKTNTAEWSKITREILEVSDDYVIPDLESTLKFYKEGISRYLVASSLKDVLKKRGSFDINVELTTAKGNLRQVRIIGYSEFKNGKCEKISGTFHDIGSY